MRACVRACVRACMHVTPNNIIIASMITRINIFWLHSQKESHKGNCMVVDKKQEGRQRYGLTTSRHKWGMTHAELVRRNRDESNDACR